MNPPTEKDDLRDERFGPRDQFVRQVDDNSRPASQVLREQLDGRRAEDAAPLFVP